MAQLAGASVSFAPASFLHQTSVRVSGGLCPRLAFREMHLARPLALLLALPLALCLWAWQQRRRGALRFSAVRLFSGLPAGRASWVQRGGLILRAIACGLLLIAVTGVRWPDPGSRVPTEGVSIVLVLDVSDSMDNLDFLDEGGLQTRWQAVLKTARLLMRGGKAGSQTFPGRPNDLFALVTFAHRPETDCPLTLDHQALLGILDEETPRKLQPTNPGDALAWGLHLLSKAPTRRKVLIFVSDGEDNVREDNVRPKQAAEMAKAMGVPIYGVEIEPLPDESRPQEGAEARKTMTMLAQATDGRFFEAKDSAALLRAYAAIDEMERDRIDTYQFRAHLDLDHWFAGAALAVFLTLLTLEATRWRRAP